MRPSKLVPLAAVLLALLAAPFAARGADRQVTDDTGRVVEIPVEPKRVVVMHEPLLGLPLIDLGLEPVGSYGRADDGSPLSAVDFIDTVMGQSGAKPKGFGPFGRIDLERLRALDPDLIIGTERDVDKAEQLSTIAPTYLQTVSTGRVHGFGVEKDLADLVGRQDAYAERLKTYETRLAEVAKRVPGGADKIYLAIITNDQLNLVGDMSGAIQAIEDLGFRRADLSGTEAGAGPGTLFSVPLSPETLGMADPDLLVVMNSYAVADRSPQATQARLDTIMPGWRSFLKPAREGRVLYLDSAKVATPTIASALHTLDAIEAFEKGR
ncbi:ABC transporter substrate-binding protein [Fulvimarina manganoxydans]|uniref:ABC transporter substrate-binding protein n=1 Tax=Fulvimarina manganoxydans TaxID=937218 RepID=UPI001FCDEF28|nr:ABC transporter substrate-binding protein [Fulvimarina manganoxydans]